MKTTMKTLAALLGVLLLSLIPAKAVSVTFDRNVAADFSTTDSLQGLNATVGTGWAMYIGNGPDGIHGQNIAANGNVTSRLTDASSADAPTLLVLAGDNTVGWDFNVSSLAGTAADRKLVSLTIWQKAWEAPRAGSDYHLFTSLNGIDWTAITGADAVFWQPGVSTAPTYNKITFTFATNEVSNFNYIRVQDKTFGGVNTPITEIDAVVTGASDATTSHVSSSSNPQALGSEVTFTATVTTTGLSDPTGSVTFKDGSSTLGSVALTGLGGGSAEATYSTSALVLGSHTITAEYVSDSAAFTNSSSTLTQFINTPGSAFPVTFEYDTQLFTPGALTGQGTPAWSEKFLSGYDAGGTVGSSESYSGGSQALNVAGYSTSRVTLASPVQDQWFEFAFKPNFTNGTPGTTWALTTRGGSADQWGIMMGLRWDGSVGTVYVGGIGAGVTGNGTAIGSFTNGQWQTISFKTNNTIGNYKVYLGGNSTSLGTFDPAGFNGVQTLVFSSATQSWDNTGNWYVDNINVGAQSVYVTGPTTVPYATWATTNAGGQAADLDWDNDGVSNGVEFFMDSRAGFTANKQLVGNTVTWPNGGNIDSADYGSKFVVQTSTDLASWTDVPGTGDANLVKTSSSVAYTLSGSGKNFVRLKVTP